MGQCHAESEKLHATNDSPEVNSDSDNHAMEAKGAKVLEEKSLSISIPIPESKGEKEKQNKKGGEERMPHRMKSVPQTDRPKTQNRLKKQYSWRNKSGRKVPTLDLHLASLDQPIVGVRMCPQMTHVDPSQKPKVVKWLRRAAELKDGKWHEICVSYLYTPTDEDLSCKLRVEFVADGRPYAIVSDIVLPAPKSPNTRNWTRRSVKRPLKRSHRNSVVTGESAGSVEDESGSTTRETWKVLSWNTLADEATNSWEKKCEKHMLMWPYRIRNLMRHIRKQDADILCLQEIDKRHRMTWWNPNLREYDAQYAGGKYGCSIYFRKQKFYLENDYKVCFETLLSGLFKEKVKDYYKKHSEQQTEIQACYEKLKISRKGLVCEFTPMESEVSDDGRKDRPDAKVSSEDRNGEVPSNKRNSRENNLFVANVHLYKSDKKKEPYIRLLQIYALLQELEKITAGVKNPKIVIAGDFNSTPNSSIYEYMESGIIDHTHEELKDCVLLRELMPTMKHSFKLSSSYKEILGKEEQYCRFSTKLEDVVEYIWYTRQEDFHARGVVPFPEEERHVYPQINMISSDHQILLSEFQTNRIVPYRPPMTKPSSQFVSGNSRPNYHHQHSQSVPPASFSRPLSDFTPDSGTPKAAALTKMNGLPSEARQGRTRANFMGQNTRMYTNGGGCTPRGAERRKKGNVFGCKGSFDARKRGAFSDRESNESAPEKLTPTELRNKNDAW
eukprot:CAMPEP_0114521638 /NCGR_PEP_ID=MMETSP0109-20121206/20291_1 /TAXON_ID=29199 /ORGANISM="Chlorarachnion reptans, Strain CCCM449" /LENGTH=725 /DNA_ID=CAMNT_0001702753 /DNA_START=302 /DNA_END=2476 /DNA_ORIENTATION=-